MAEAEAADGKARTTLRTMNRRTLLFGFGLLGAMGLTTGGTVYALNTLGLAPKPTLPPEPGPDAPPRADHPESASAAHDAPTPRKAVGGDEPAAAGDAHAAADIAHWSYAGSTGPDSWGKLEPANAVCSVGGAQSPIDLTHAVRVPALAGLDLTYASTRVKVTNTGYTFQVNVDKGSSIKIDGKRFDLLQFHFHLPSEHTVDGKPFPMEMHLVHQGPDQSLVVLGVLIAQGASNLAFGRFWDKLPKAAGETADSGASLDLAELLPRDTDSYFTYSGSLTTPPCTESVRWLVLQMPVQASRPQIESFRGVFPMNARPIMPLGARYLLSS
jgi:carbonic anhydrase